MDKPSLIKIIYASTSGNVEIVCQKIAEVLEKQGLKTSLHRAEQTKIDEVKNHDYFILATSTWEHGAINPFFKPLREEIKKTDMSGKFAGIVGLGDTRYEEVLFCEGAEKLKRAFISSGGKVIYNTLKIDGEPYDLLDTAVTDWANYFLKTLIGDE